MKNTIVSLQRFFATHFPRGEDAIWKEWVDTISRGEWNSLVSLLGSDVRDSFKKRALFLLIVPSDEFNPLYWRGTTTLKPYCGERFLCALRVLSSKLLSYCADLVCDFCSELRKDFCDRPESFAERARSMTIFCTIPDKWHEVLWTYNKFILELLALLSEEEGEKLFRLYSLRDISVFSNMEDASGYSPFEQLLRSKDIAEYWKVKADLKMRNIIRAEIAGQSKPREEWEEALVCYASIINRFVWDDVPLYPLGLFESQVRFLAEYHTAEQPLIEGWKLPKLLRALSGSDSGFRHQILHTLVVDYRKDDWRRFSVSGEGDVEVARQWMSEFRDDRELVDRLSALVDEFNAREVAEKERVDEKKRAQDDTLAKMK